MHRYLYLLRHAQSADKQPGHTDKERSLTPLGMKEAKSVGIFLEERSLIPELIISSSAFRAKTTAGVVADILNYDTEKIRISDDLYEATIPTFFETLSQINDTINSVLIVGHNPTISYFADSLTHDQNNFRPAEILTLKIESDNWNNVQRGNTEVTARFHPTV